MQLLNHIRLLAQYYEHNIFLALIIILCKLLITCKLIAGATPLTISGNYPHIMLYHGENHHYRPSCSRGNVFGVLCQGDTSKPKQCKHGDVRLVNGSRKTEGRLEFCAYGYWSNLCNDYSSSLSYLLELTNAWPWKAPYLICRKLGFPTEGN